MNPALIPLIADAFKGLFGIGKELIVDKDKQIEYAFKLAELQQQFSMQLVSQATVPWVDATVKLMYALNSLWRPIGGALMTAFGIYAHWKGIKIEPALHAVFDGAFPAWGVSRHINKQNGKG